ncbi:helix-turn-helix domain-containing protein [Solimonas flava]|uniref:helix-turn-helix domain-containing protein n=1 Tax=Solimonas flava TaxID=415849 RepID=UPI00041BF469|nr:AraC family transcriptional regulator [Solimonas flava]
MNELLSQASSLYAARSMHASGLGPYAFARAEPPRPRPGLSPRALQRAIAFMQAHLGERFGLNALAAAACVSRAHFARLFHASTGMTPMACMQALRVARAIELLRAGQLSICEIAATLAFCDQSHFTRVFRRTTGLTPRAYLSAGAREAASLTIAHAHTSRAAVQAPSLSASHRAAAAPARRSVVASHPAVCPSRETPCP